MSILWMMYLMTDYLCLRVLLDNGCSVLSELSICNLGFALLVLPHPIFIFNVRIQLIMVFFGYFTKACI